MSTMDRFKNAVNHLWIDQSYTEGNIGWHALIFGLFFLAHPHMYDSLPYTSTNQAIMAPFMKVGPPWTWGVWFSVYGLGKIVAVYTGNYRARRVMSLVGFLSWGFLSCVLWQVSHQAIGLSVFIWFSLVCSFSHIRVGLRHNAVR